MGKTAPNFLPRRKPTRNVTPVLPAWVSSPRLDTLRELFARLDAACAAPSTSKRADAELNDACDGITALGRDIIANPAPGLAGVAELAMAAQYWFRPPPHQGSAWDPKSPDSVAVCALIAGVFALCEGGANG